MMNNSLDERKAFAEKKLGELQYELEELLTFIVSVKSEVRFIDSEEQAVAFDDKIDKKLDSLKYIRVFM